MSAQAPAAFSRAGAFALVAGGFALFLALLWLIGAGGGALQSASRTMMVRQADPDKITESFGLYALTGKATSFVAPLTIGWVTQISGNQAIGITPLIVLFLLGLALLHWVDPNGRPQKDKPNDVFA